MNAQPVKIREGLILFKGNIPGNLFLAPISSNTYFLEDGDDVTIFDPSCGRIIARAVEAYIRKRLDAQAKWRKAFLVAGHSHLDHANNFYLIDATRASESHIYVHESGFQDGKVKNEPVPFIENMFKESRKYFNIFLTYSFPYNLLIYPCVAIDALSPALACKLAARVGGIPWPFPVDGSTSPEPLREVDIQTIKLWDYDIKGWRMGNKIILPTPGHTPCSVSLLWPQQKALFTSDADWMGNPVFAPESMRDSISSLKKLKEIAEAGKIELLLPGHGQVKEGVEQVLSYIDFNIRRIEVIRNEVLATFNACDKEKDVRKLTRVLIKESPYFRMLKLANYPKMVVFVYNIVAVCLREEGILN